MTTSAIDYQVVLDNLDEKILIVNCTEDILYVNNAYVRDTGIAAENLIGYIQGVKSLKQASQILDVDISTVSRKLKQYGLSIKH